MTRVRLIKRKGCLIGFEASGHSDYADEGYDIVCAAISAVTQTCEIGLTDVLGLKPGVQRSDEDGWYRVELNGNESQAELEQAQLLFKTMSAGLKSIELGYPDFIRVDA